MHGGCVEDYQAELTCYACCQLPDLRFSHAFAHQSELPLLLTPAGRAVVADGRKKSLVQV